MDGFLGHGFLGPYPLTWVVPLQLGGVAERDVIDVDKFLGLGLVTNPEPFILFITINVVRLCTGV